MNENGQSNMILLRGSKLTIWLDEGLYHLKEGLRDAGFKVLILEEGISDDEIGRLCECNSILTKNADKFVFNSFVTF